MVANHSIHWINWLCQVYLCILFLLDLSVLKELLFADGSFYCVKEVKITGKYNCILINIKIFLLSLLYLLVRIVCTSVFPLNLKVLLFYTLIIRSSLSYYLYNGRKIIIQLTKIWNEWYCISIDTSSRFPRTYFSFIWALFIICYNK